jgi:hypothetical protein
MRLRTVEQSWHAGRLEAHLRFREAMNEQVWWIRITNGITITSERIYVINTNGRRSTIIVMGLGLFAIALAVVLQPAQAQRVDSDHAGGVPHYTVVATEGHNLIVTDNVTNTLSFYTIDEEAEIGSELKLRGTIDLNQVGKPSIKPMDHRGNN